MANMIYTLIHVWKMVFGLEIARVSMDRIRLAQYREPAESSSEYSYGCRFP